MGGYFMAGRRFASSRFGRDAQYLARSKFTAESFSPRRSS